MTITVNPDLNLVVEQPLSRLPLAVVKLPRGPKVPIWVQFARDGAVIDPSEALTSGTLVIGLYYKITAFVAGDSFTNVGAASNATSVYFLCTGTTPTTWTNSSTLQQCDSAGVLFSLIFSVKKNGEYDGAVLVLATGTDFTKFGTGTSTIFKSKCSFSTAEINTLLGVDSSVANDESEVTLMGEVSWLGPDESKAFPFQIDLQNDSYKTNDVVTSTPGVQAMSLVTTSTEALLTGSHVITGSSTVTVTPTTGLVTLSVPSELVVPSQTGNSGKYLTTNGAATSWGTVTGVVTSITGTANEITVTGTTTPTLSLPSALTFTGKTITGGTFASPSFTTPTIGDGTESAPSLSFTSDTNTGVYRPAADTVGIVGGGNDVVRLTGIASATDYIEIKNGIGVGSPLHVLAEGGSANIGVHLQPKGSGLFTISDGTDFNKGIRFRSSSSAASAITLLDAVSTAGRVITLPDATGTLALVSGDLGTPSAIVLTNASGTANININGTVGATTPSTVAGTTGTFDSTVTVGANSTAGTLNVKDSGGTPTASIDGSDGSASFSSGKATIDSNGAASFANGALTIDQYGNLASHSSLNVDYGVVIGGAVGGPGTLYVKNSSGTTTASIDGTEGTASFAEGGLAIDQYGNITTNGGAQATLDYFNAVFQVNVGHDSNAGTLNINNASNTTTATISGADGSASFASGACTINGSGYAGAGSGLTALNASNVSSGTLAAARMANAGVHTGDATGTFPAITLNAAQTGITSVGTLTGGATGAGFTVALSTSTITGTLADARLSANVPLKDAANTFTNTQSMTSPAITTSITTPSTTFAIANTTATTLNIGGAATTIAMGAAGAGTMNIPLTTSASSATTGALTIGNGTAATNVGIGGGNIRAGGSIFCGSLYPGGSVSPYIEYPGGVILGCSGSWRLNGTLYIGGLLDTTVVRSSAGVIGLQALAVTGATTLTGNLTSNGAYISTPQALSGNGAVAAVNLTTEITTIANTGTANTTTTLAAGTNGQKKVISFITDGGFDAVITVTNPAWGGAGTITMNDALDNIELRYLNSVWQVFINNGCTLA